MGAIGQIWRFRLAAWKVRVQFALAFCMAAGTAGAETCMLSREANALLRGLQIIAQESDAIDQAARSRIGELIWSLDRAQVSVANPDRRHARTRLFSDRIRAEAQNVLEKGDAVSSKELSKRLDALDRLAPAPCRASKGSASGSAAKATTQTEGRGSSNFVDVGYGSHSSLVFVLLLTSGIIGVLYGIQFAYRWGFAFVYHRKACLIHSAIEIGKDAVDGYVTIIGMKGCRFQPVNDQAFNRLKKLAGSGKAYVQFGVERIAAEIDGFHDHPRGGFLVVYFDTPLVIARLTDFLQDSAITPYYVKKATPRSKKK